MPKTVKVAFAGGMAAGKTSVAEALAMHCDSSQILSFASPVKEIALNIFGMKQKNRKLLQDIGTAYRKVNEDVWVNFLLGRIEDKVDLLVVDDVRYENEFKALKAHGFTVIWLETSLNTRIKRLKKKYGVRSDEHVIGLRHSSERHDQIKALADLTYDTDQMSSTSISASIWSSLTCETASGRSAVSS